MKNFEIKNQNGRSMIEMLGVLAIIGVLSVGGIAGYSKAMTKYRINKAIEQITLIAGNVKTFFKGNIDLRSNRDTILRKAKIIPEDMWEYYTDGRFKKFINIFGMTVDVYSAGNKDDFRLLYHIPRSSQEECIEILSYNWNNAGSIGVTFEPGGENDDGDTMWCSYGFPLNIDQAIEACESTHDYQSYIPFQFYFGSNRTFSNTCE